MINKFNISANIVARNEKYWIKESILSIVELVDEIIYVDDKSDDGTLDAVIELSSVYKNIKIFTHEDHGLSHLGDLKNFAKNKSSNKLVLRWDADFIAYDEIVNLFKFATANINKYDGYILKGPNLEGDIWHTNSDKDHFGPEIYLFNQYKMKFVQTERYNDHPIFDKDTKYCYPLKTKLKRNHFFIHTNKLKSLKRLSYRRRMSEYLNSNFNGSYWQFIHPDMNEIDAINLEIEKLKNETYNLVAFDFEKWGKHPEILLNSEYASIFKIKEFSEQFKLDYPEN